MFQLSKIAVLIMTQSLNNVYGICNAPIAVFLFWETSNLHLKKPIHRKCGAKLKVLGDMPTPAGPLVDTLRIKNHVLNWPRETRDRMTLMPLRNILKLIFIGIKTVLFYI